MGKGQSTIQSYSHKKRRRSDDFDSKSGLEAQNNDETETSHINRIQPEHASIEIEEVTQNPSRLPTKIETLNNKDDFLGFFDMNDESADDESSLMIKFQFKDILTELDPKNLQNISKKFHEKSKVLFLMSESEEKFSIYWKSKEIDEFLELKQIKKLDWESDQSLSEHISEFLAKSLNNDHLGLTRKFTFHPGSKPIDIDLLADSRDYNLLLLAAEKGNTKMVEILLKLDMSTSSMDNKVDSQSLAMEHQHFDVIYALLQNNLMYPKTFNINNCTGILKEFCEVTEEVHRLILSNDKDKLEKILNHHKNLRHFYNFLNKSALRVAIESQSFDVFDLLLSKNLRFGSNENPAEYYEQMDTDSKRTLRDIQNKYSQPFLDKHIHTLLSKSTACFDETEAKDKLTHVQRAFELLSENPFIKIILKIVAASKNFKIVFDFNREAVNVVDPTTTKFSQGIFYLSGKIFIGAKQLLDPETVNDTLAVLAHELCHFAMNLVYKNHAKPYRSQDKKTMEEFEEVLRDCETESEVEEVIGSVFDCYPKEAHHAELIVRVVHLLALYRDMPEIIAQERRIFIELFEFYENKIVPELEQALPELEGRDEKELKIKDKKSSKLRIISIIGGVLAVIGIVAAIVIALLLYTPTYSFDDLPVNDRRTILLAPIKYKGVDLEFRDLFPENSTSYGNLTSEHISKILNGNIMDFSDPHFRYLEEKVTHKWKNMSRKLKHKVLTSNFTFQNESLKFEKLHEINSEVFNSLSSEQILEVLDGKKLIVHEMIKNETKFYFKRKFWDENIPEIYVEFMKFVDRIHFNYCSSENRTKTNKTFKSFYLDFISQNISIQLNKIDKIGKMRIFKDCLLSDLKIVEPEDYNSSDTLLSHKSLQFDFDQVLKIVNETKLFILSSEAGTGKTVTFEQFTMRIKKEFPSRWVSYIDLKDYKYLYKGIQTLQDVRNMLETIFKLSSKNEFEKKIFEYFFESGNLILLWNGFDEISPDYSEYVIRILRLIRNGTENIQFVCTRPLYSDQLRINFSVQIYSLIPFDEEQQKSFISKCLISENVEQIEIQNYVFKVQKIVESTKSTEPFDTPLLLGMIAELIANDVEIYESENLFEIYQKFVKKKVEIWKNKTEFGRNFLDDSITKYRHFDIMKLYQSYALKSKLQGKILAYLSALKLKAMNQKVPKELTSDEISRMGILYINGPGIFKFSHRTFEEFFIAQYFIENIYNADDNPSDEEAELRIYTFSNVFTYLQIDKFIKSFLNSKECVESKPFDRKVSKVLTTKYQKLLFANNKDLLLIDFFKKDLKVLNILLRIDENKTVYTALFNYAEMYNYIDLTLIKNAVRLYLTDDKFERFIRGKYQKGVILFSEYCNRLSRRNLTHDFYKLDEELKTNNDPFYVFESIAKNLTDNELKELFLSGITFNYVQSPDKKYYIMFDEKMWNLIESRLTKSDQKDILTRSLKEIFLGLKQNLLNFMLSKCDKFFSSNEIVHLFGNRHVLVEFSYNDKIFQTFWTFFINHTNRDQQKAVLKQTKTCNEQICRPYGLLFGAAYEFDKMKIIYESYFNTTELQEIVLSHPTDVLPYIVIQSHERTFNKIMQFLVKVFQNSKNLLREFLLRKIEPTNVNIFEHLNDYNDQYGKLKALSLFLSSDYWQCK